MIVAIVGESDRDAEARARRILERLGPSSPLRGMFDRMKTAGLVGTPAAVAAGLRAFEAEGVSRLFIQNFDFEDLSAVALMGELARALA
jgi:alkanesulfonate monooxygenase SsuD/methylene tetrahydromethanopterin reductase-like flavin-dependent oxidoreductase (luciferase family)